MKTYKNYLPLGDKSVGNERRYELLNDVLNNGSFLPKTVTYADIDDAFKEWVKSLTIVSDEGVEYPTMSLYSNQRFSEYSQTWSYTDKNKNIILNFKTVTRENNPKFGTIRGGLHNIPGDRFYLVKRKIVLDDNGSESLLDLEMKLPTAVDLIYKVSIFTNKYQSLNKFNSLINRKFAGIQCYLSPNGHYMPMTLENISDESEYKIDDRQFYSQTYQIKTMGYILEENDYRTREVPLKIGLNSSMLPSNKADVEIEELETLSSKETPLILTMKFEGQKRYAKFTIDCRFISSDISFTNIRPNYKVSVNDEVIDKENIPLLNLYEGDTVKVTITKTDRSKDGILIINGFSPSNDNDYNKKEEIEYDFSSM